MLDTVFFGSSQRSHIFFLKIVREYSNFIKAKTLHRLDKIVFVFEREPYRPVIRTMDEFSSIFTFF